MKPKVTNDEQQHSALFSGLKRCLDFWPAAIARFVNKSGFVHASSLSFTTLIGLIPVLAVGLSVATSLMFKDGDEGREEVEVWIDTMVKTVAPMLDLEIRDSETVFRLQLFVSPQMLILKDFVAILDLILQSFSSFLSCDKVTFHIADFFFYFSL